MTEGSALSRLRDDELCIVKTPEGEREMRWNAAARSFFYLVNGVPIACEADAIEEWWPVGTLA